MNADVYEAELVKAYMMAQVLREMPLGEMHQAIEHTHAVGPILHPTLYRDRAKAMSQDQEVARILLHAKRELDKLPWPAEAPA